MAANTAAVCHDVSRLTRVSSVPPIAAPTSGMNAMKAAIAASRTAKGAPAMASAVNATAPLRAATKDWPIT